MTNENILIIILYLVLYFSFIKYWFSITLYIDLIFEKIVTVFQCKEYINDFIFGLSFHDFIFNSGHILILIYCANGIIPIIVKSVYIYFIKFSLGLTIFNNFFDVTPITNYDFMSSIINNFYFYVDSIEQSEVEILVQGFQGESINLKYFIRMVPKLRMFQLEDFLGIHHDYLIDKIKHIGLKYDVVITDYNFPRHAEMYLLECADFYDINFNINSRELQLRIKVFEFLSTANYDVSAYTYEGPQSLRVYKHFARFLLRKYGLFGG